MPLVKQNEPLGERPVIILIYGEPGIGKTSLFNTANNPLLIDFDRGVDRSILRKDTLVVNTWEDVLQEEQAGTFKAYETIGIDTAKAALDDFLMSYVCKKDPKNQKNKLAMYGAIGDEFKLFISNRRSENADIVIIAHAKDEKEGDVVSKYPDVTGGSYNLLLRIADQVGYMKTVNNKRTIQFEPTDIMKGKNVARLPIQEVPNEADPKFQTFMADLIGAVKQAISSQNEAQREAVATSEKYQQQVKAITTPEDLTELLKKVNELPDYLKIPLRKLVSDKSKEMNWVADKQTGTFKVAPAEAQPEQAKEGSAEPGAEIAATSLDDRCKLLETFGVVMEADGFTAAGKYMVYEELTAMGENEFNGFLASLKKPAAKKRSGKATATA